MNVYTYSEARQQLARLLDEARDGGEVRIKRRDGSVFAVRPVIEDGSPLDALQRLMARPLTTELSTPGTEETIPG